MAPNIIEVLYDVLVVVWLSAFVRFSYDVLRRFALTHWGRVTHICVSKLSIIGSDNGLSPDRRQAIIWTNAGILLIGTLGTNFNEISFEIHIFPFKNFHLKMSSGKWRLFCLGLNVLTWKVKWDLITTAPFYNAYPQETGAVVIKISFQFAR